MKQPLLRLCLFSSLAVSASLCVFHTAYAQHIQQLIPAVKSGFYYQIGGGNDVPLPAFYDTSYIPLTVDSDVGLGFDCGSFNPVASIKNSLNNIKNSAMNVEQQVLTDATGAVTEFPLYELSRADPNLYNLITNAMAGAQDDIAVSTKSCETMQSEIAAGQNPYAHWGQISLGNRWQQDIGSAELSGNGDINQARHDAASDAGKSGVPWVNPSSLSSANGNNYAGGQNQPPIHVIHDTAMSGYNVIAHDSQSSVSSEHLFSDSQPELSQVFPNAKAAADWVTQVVGDETITTYNGGQKNSTPGVGLYVDIQQQMQQLLPKLQAFVTGSKPLTDVKDLAALSPDGLTVSPELIQSIQKQPSKVMQAIITNKLAQNMAAMAVINKARLAVRVLQSGARVPAIYANQAAQKNIQNAIERLQNDVQAMLMYVKARQTLMSNMMSTVVQAGQSQEAKNTAVAVPKQMEPMMTNGSIANKSTA